MKANYRNGQLVIDAGNKMDIDEISEFVQFLLIFVSPSHVDIKQIVADNNRSEITLDVKQEDAELLCDKLLISLDVAC